MYNNILKLHFYQKFHIYQMMKRIAIIGIPGSGKSTFAHRLGLKLNIPVTHLDTYVFDGKKLRDHQEFVHLQELLVKKEFWIIEGCSIKTLNIRFEQADTIIYMKLPRWLCLWRTVKRILHRDELLSRSGCVQTFSWNLITYIWNFERAKEPEIMRLKAAYPQVHFIQINSSKEAEAFISVHD